MIKVKYLLGIFLLIIGLILGCSSESKTENLINYDQVAWVSADFSSPMSAGPYFDKPKILFPETDSIKIKKIVTMLNRAKKQKLSETDIRNNERESGVLIVELKSGEKIYVYNTRDKIILSVYGKGNLILESKILRKYLENEMRKDMPDVRILSITPKTVKEGEKVVIEGERSAGKVQIFIEEAQFKNYLLAEVKPKNGKWKWEGTIQREFQTYDGKEVILKSGKYYYFLVNSTSGAIGYGQIVIDKSK